MADAGDRAAEAANRDLWTQANREYGDEHAARAWAADYPRVRRSTDRALDARGRWYSA